MRQNRISDLLFIIIFLLSTSLRLTLAIVNREANDNHLEVVNMIMRDGSLPRANDCWQCFHPKLFHYTISAIFQLIGMDPGDTTAQIIFSQLLNASMGTITIIIIWIFLRHLFFLEEQMKVITFGLVAFNPKLIGINAQVTNDSMAILLVTLAVYSSWLFLKQKRGVGLWVCIIFISLGIAAKTTAIPAAGAILITLLVKAWKTKETAVFWAGILFPISVLVLSFFNPLTQYTRNYRDSGSPIRIHEGMKQQPFPAFTEESYVARPGIVSIVDGILTFKYFNLLEYPRLTNGAEDYPAHRTSLWTQLYARANSVHFDNWPDSWGTKGDEGFALTRSIYVLALPFAAMLLVGAAISLIGFFKVLLSNSLDSLSRSDYGLFDIIFWGYAAFIVFYALSYRDFSVMKAIFIYPAALSFIVLFIRSASAIQEFLRGAKWFMVTLSSLTTALVVLYILDMYTLIAHLYSLLDRS